MSSPSIEFYNAALDALEAGDAPEALAAIVNSLTEDPNDTQTWQLYIVILNALGRKEDALRATAKLKEKGLSEADAHILQASQAAASNDLAAAIPHYQAAAALEPGRSEIHTGLAIAHMQAGDADAALSAAEKAVGIDPTDSRAQYALGHILRLSGKKEPALAALTAAVSSDPDFMIALYEQGMLLADSGRLEEALANFEKFLKTHPSDPSANEAVANIRQRLNS